MPEPMGILAGAHCAEASASLWQMALDTMTDGVAVADAAGSLRFANQTYRRWFAAGGPVTGGGLPDPALESRLAAVLATGNPVVNEPVFVRALGRYLMVTLTPLGEAGSVTGATALFREGGEVRQIAVALRGRQSPAPGGSIRAGLPPAFQALVGEDPDLVKTLSLAAQVAVTDSTILLLGESGTGKEVLAGAIVAGSRRSGRPHVRVNCAALPDELLESELFGYEAGAFTGAREKGRPGYFEMANHGTLFLDEIGDVPLRMQAKLLRAIESREIDRVGADRSIAVDVRLIAATNRNLLEMVRAGTFREDLYYRLNVFPMCLPPLRDRPGDVPLLIEHFVAERSREAGRRLQLAAEAFDTLVGFDWPGNVRELKNVMEYAATLCPDGTITLQHLPHYLVESQMAAGLQHWLQPDLGSLPEALHSLERRAIEVALQLCHYNCSQAMALLGVSRKTFYRRLQEYGLSAQVGDRRRGVSA